MTPASDYGNYRLVFEAPTDQITPGVEMTLSGEANLDQMLTFFEAFLKASGYYFDGDLQIVPPLVEQEFAPFDSFNFDGDGVPFMGGNFTPYSSDTLHFGGGRVVGGLSNDTIILG